MRKVSNTKKFIYLISPKSIVNCKEFFKDLELVLKSKKIFFFQLRLKKENKKKIIYIGKKVKEICKKNKVNLIINDNPNIAKIIGADGCHLGQKDTSIIKAKEILKKKIIGITCHNSKKLVYKAIQNKADYIAIGAFFKSFTKNTDFKATISLLKFVKKITRIPIVAIGGINNKNYKKLLLNKANFLAISGYIWNNKKFKPGEAIKKFR